MFDRGKSRVSGAILVLVLGQAVPSQAASLHEQLAPLADKIAAALGDDRITAVAVGAFQAEKGAAPEAAPGMAKTLADLLGQRRLSLDAKASTHLTGRYTPLVGTDGRQTGVRVTAEVRAEGKAVRTFEGEVLFLAEAASVEADGARALAPLVGLTAVLPPDESLKQRLQKFHDGSEKPHAYLDGDRVRAARSSPYAVEILVKDRPVAPVVRGGRAHVDLKEGDHYAVRLTNDTDQPAAATLSVDGLSLFAFSEQKDYRFVVVPAKQAAVLRGWHRTNEESDAFEITTYSKSAAAQRLPQAPKLGAVTATFAVCWPKNQRPPDEERAARLAASRGEKLGTGRGPVVKSSFEEVEMHLGAVRAAVTVRYDRKGDTP